MPINEKPIAKHSNEIYLSQPRTSSMKYQRVCVSVCAFGVFSEREVYSRKGSKNVRPCHCGLCLYIYLSKISLTKLVIPVLLHSFAGSSPPPPVKMRSDSFVDLVLDLCVMAIRTSSEMKPVRIRVIADQCHLNQRFYIVIKSDSDIC